MQERKAPVALILVWEDQQEFIPIPDGACERDSAKQREFFRFLKFDRLSPYPWLPDHVELDPFYAAAGYRFSGDYRFVTHTAPWRHITYEIPPKRFEEMKAERQRILEQEERRNREAEVAKAAKKAAKRAARNILATGRTVTKG